MAGSGTDEEEDLVQLQPPDVRLAASDDESACWSSDVTWGASDFDIVTDDWADAFNSDATPPHDAEPYYELDQ